MAVQHIAPSELLVPPFDAKSRAVETVVLVVVALPDAAGDDLPAAVVEAAGNVIGDNHVLDVSVQDRVSVVLRLRTAGGGERRVVDPALGPALEAELAAVLIARGHSRVSVAVASAGPPRSERDRDREL